jgi:hypothetical protein
MEMIATLAGWLETSAAGQFVRDHKILYPAANVVHLVSVMVFFAAVAVVDLRVMGFIQGAPIERVITRFRRAAIVALCFLVPSGLVLFLPEAAAMVRNPSFQLKFAAIAAGILNLLLFQLITFRSQRAGEMSEAPFLARMSAGLSLLIWLTAAAAGRFVAYA